MTWDAGLVESTTPLDDGEPVPEPATVGLVGFGLVTLQLAAARRANKAE